MKRTSLLCALLLLCTMIGLFAACDSPNSPQEVQVTETDYHISSSITTFTANTPYRFVVKNTGKIAHEFMIMPRASDNSAMGDTLMNHSHAASMASIEVINAGQTKTIDYTFPASAKGSRPQIACYYEGHYEAGMWLNLEVK